MKKRTTLLCVLALGLSLSACGSKNGADASGEQTSSGQTQESSMQQSSQQPSSESPAEPSGTMEEETGWSKEMEKVKAAITEALGENYWPNFQVPKDMLESTYGISEDLYDDYLAETPMISTNVDTLIIVKAKEDKVGEVEDALEAYRDKMVADTMQYPMNLGKIQASRIEVIEDYVCFVQLGADTTHALEQGDEAVIAQCQEQNEMVLEVIRNVKIQ